MNNATPFKLGTFSAADAAPFVGVVLNERVTALRELGAPLAAYGTMLELLADWQRSFEALSRAVSTAEQRGRPLSEVRVHAPVPKPGTIYCSGANYKKHVVDLIVAHQDQSETHGMTLEQKR